jgi:sugar/nucleoside kinase (ribokinase family)
MQSLLVNFCFPGSFTTSSYTLEKPVSVLVVGSLALDTIETPFGSAKDAVGGSAVFISTAASYFFSPIRLVGIVGGDFPKHALAFLERRNVDLEGLEIIEKGKTFRWSGRYHYDLNERDTLSTDLNVFEKFDPKIPVKYRKSRWVCLGNIDPVLQLKVLDQIEKPRAVICDTMNYWIERKQKELRETLRQIDVLILNESEARLLSREPNLIKSGKVIRGMGPSIVIIKKGEHGALLLTENVVFSAPAYPMENIFDPTGAGDAFAGGFVGWLARTDDLSEENLKRAVIYGSTLASFTVEKFGIDGLRDLNYLQIHDRVREFRELTRFDED